MDTTQLLKGVLDVAVLAVVAGEDGYGYDVVRRLRAAGLTDDQVGRLFGPIGLDLGGRTPAETALAIMAEIVAVRHGAAVARPA